MGNLGSSAAIEYFGLTTSGLTEEQAKFELLDFWERVSPRVYERLDDGNWSTPHGDALAEVFSSASLGSDGWSVEWRGVSAGAPLPEKAVVALANMGHGLGGAE